MLLLVLMPMAYADLIVNSGDSILNNDDNTYTKITHVVFPSEDRFLAKNLRLSIELGCEDLEVFNSANPQYTIRNVSLKTSYIHKLIFNTTTGTSINPPVFETIRKDYGCTDNSPSCDVTNTPITTGGTSTFFRQLACILGFATCPVELASIRQIDFNLIDGEVLDLFMVTYFNGTSIVEDSFCTYGISLDSQNCRGCDEKSFEETVKELETRQDNFETKTTIFNFVNNLIDLNYQLWVIISYIVKIGVLIGAIFGLIYI